MPKQELVYPYEITNAVNLTALGTYDPTNLDLKLEWAPERVDGDGIRVLDLRGVGPTGDDAMAGWSELNPSVAIREGVRRPSACPGSGGTRP